MKYLKIQDSLFMQGGCDKDQSFLLEVRDDIYLSVANDIHDILVNNDDCQYDVLMDYVETTEGVSIVKPIVPDVVIEW